MMVSDLSAPASLQLPNNSAAFQHEHVPADGHKHSSVYPMRVCVRCNALRLERCSRKGFWQAFLSFFSFFPYKCRSCFRRQYCFVPSVHLLHSAWIFTLVLWTGLLGARTLQMAAKGSSATAASNMADAAYAGRTSGAGMTSFERLMLARKKQVMRNEDVVQLVHSGVNPALMITIMRNSDAAFDLTPKGVVHLKESGVEDLIISTMFERSTQLALTAAQ